jgi:predicted DCC family thiol-disulfide oxidoreductase YuxK
MPEDAKIRVYYDGSCSMCSRFCRMIEKSPHSDKIEQVDYTAENFDAEAEGLDREALDRELHARRNDGEVLRGFDAIVAIWDVSGKTWLARLGRLPVVHGLCAWCYRIFARNRHWFGNEQ